jgi:hypothetical protein
MLVIWPLIVSGSLLLPTPHIFPWHKLYCFVFGGHHLSVKNPYMLAFDLNQNSRFGCFRPKMLAICLLIVSERVSLLTLHMFCWHKPHYFIFVETIYRSKIYVLAFDTNENSRFGRFQSKLLAICPFIMSVILLLFNPYKFSWYKPHHLVVGGDHLFNKNPRVHAFIC